MMLLAFVFASAVSPLGADPRHQYSEVDLRPFIRPACNPQLDPKPVDLTKAPALSAPPASGQVACLDRSAAQRSLTLDSRRREPAPRVQTP